MMERTAGSRERVVEVPAHLAYGDRVTESAIARVVIRNDAERAMGAVIGGLTCWGLAIVSVFVPLGHFFLVPGFLLAGPVVFFMKMREGVSLRGAHGVCPMCGKEQEFVERDRLAARHPVRCAGCGRQLELVAELPGRPDKTAEAPEKPQDIRVWVAPDAHQSEAPER